MYSQSNDSFFAFPTDLVTFAWSAPMRDLAKKIGMSDVGLRKLLKSLGIVTPPQGYWNRVRAGKVVPGPPAQQERRPGETGRATLDGRFRGHVAEAGRMPVGGPFASKEVPEDLLRLREKELAAVGRAKAPRDLSRPHVGLSALLRKEESRREKCAATKWHRDEPKFETPLAKRQVRVLSGLFTTLSKRGHSGSVYEQDEQLMAECIIGDTRLGLCFEVIGNHRSERRRGYSLPARDLPGSTPLRLALAKPLPGGLPSDWEDGEERLEAMLAVIAADLVVAGEATFRRGLAEALKRERVNREWLERCEREKQERRNRERLALLEESGALLRKADEIRSLVTRIADTMECPDQGVTAEALRDWKRWALECADELDPIRSGQVFRHLLVPGN